MREVGCCWAAGGRLFAMRNLWHWIFLFFKDIPGYLALLSQFAGDDELRFVRFGAEVCGSVAVKSFEGYDAGGEGLWMQIWCDIHLRFRVQIMCIGGVFEGTLCPVR